MATNSPVIMNPGEGKKVLFLGNEMVLKAVSRDSGGQFALVEFTMAAGFGGPPPHVHHAHDETFYVIEGEMRFRVDEREIRRSRARSHTSRGASGTRSGTRARSWGQDAGRLHPRWLREVLRGRLAGVPGRSAAGPHAADGDHEEI